MRRPDLADLVRYAAGTGLTWQREEAQRRSGLPAQAVERRRQLRAPRRVNDGNGFVFIDHLGNICPSGFLPAQRGNVRTASLADVYRTDEMFTRLRDANALLGKMRPLRVP